ncbi:integrase catalytic domain-containing protein [Trichonephila clavata]|uniref:Integrase catalytic domain-containing protein n=1 Tax=Trichonephila clavata TaxID=2740835 RepID=A0A8X6G677_TRICU|nr:integrase catalytic domain-containing protein [Trichonephila clavata]
MVGPQLQTDLTTLLLRFRMHKIAITADIEKMYRQITLHDSDFQRIVWRNSPFEPIQDFRLTRIAYGTASAPYLAIKCLQQLALNESNNFPLASKAALKDFYVDDLMSGANSLSEALELQNQLTQMVSSAGLVLRKWASNCSKLLNSIDSDMRLSSTSLNIDNDDTVKTLVGRKGTPTNIKLEWEQLANDVQFVKDIKIPRFLLVDSDNLFHLFGFSDASEKAYVAAIYCRSVSDTGKINVQLIIAKTRVAPLKTVSLPRLELCGALLLVKLMDFTCKALNYPISQAQFYTDSTIVLSWIGSHASRWKTFVANRVAKIQTLSSATQWHHISGSANPADIATRGVSSSTLLTSIWFCVPKFLHETFPFQTDSFVPTLNDALPEERYCTLQSIIVPNHLPDESGSRKLNCIWLPSFEVR